MDTSNRRPELRARPAGASDASQRILSSLEHGAPAMPAALPLARRPASWQLDGWTVVLLVMLSGLALMVWMTHEGQIPARKYERRSYSTPGGYHGSLAPSTTAAGTPTMEAADSAAATIVNLPGAAAHEGGPLARRAAAPDTRQEVAAAPARAMDQAGAASSARLARRSADSMAPPAAPSAAAPLLSAPPVVASSTPPPLASAVTRAGTNAAAAAAGGPSSSARAASATADSDVTLLAALVQHGHKPALPAGPSRDVVERHDGDTTASLLARCRQLGLIESLLCRSRICSGRWEKEAACRAASN